MFFLTFVCCFGFFFKPKRFKIDEMELARSLGTLEWLGSQKEFVNCPKRHICFSGVQVRE